MRKFRDTSLSRVRPTLVVEPGSPKLNWRCSRYRTRPFNGKEDAGKRFPPGKMRDEKMRDRRTVYAPIVPWGKLTRMTEPGDRYHVRLSVLNLNDRFIDVRGICELSFVPFNSASAM
jgi:hypothetical protein